MLNSFAIKRIGLALILVSLITGCGEKKEDAAPTSASSTATALNPANGSQPASTNSNAPGKSGLPPGVDAASRPDMNAPGPRVVQ